MNYQHQVIQNHPRKIIYEFYKEIPYIPGVGDDIVFPEILWKDGERFKVTSVHHYFLSDLIVINVNKTTGG